MGTITTGVGLMSGLNIQDIVSKLMSIERVQVTHLEARVKTSTTERAALSDLSARVLAIKASLSPLKNNSFFQSNTATSSDTDILQVTANGTAQAGTFRLRVQQMATAQQLVSRGLAGPVRTPLGTGTFVVAGEQAKLAQATDLDFLNSQRGVTAGSIRITDQSGTTAQIDLTSAKTVSDIVTAINNAAGIRVRAEVQGDRLAIVDMTGLQTAALAVADVAGGKTAQDLGIAGASMSGQITGTDINTVNEHTLLSLLNDGKGVGVHGLGADFKISAADGTAFSVSLSDKDSSLGTANLEKLNGGQGVRLGVVRVTNADGHINEIDLTGLTTLDQVTDKLKAEGNVDIMIVGGNTLLVTDKSGGDKALKIEDVSGHAALDLGIAGQSAGLDSKDAETIRGTAIYMVRTIGDVIRAINYAAGNNGSVAAGIGADGKSIVLTDNTAGAGSLAVQATAGSTAAMDLGLLRASSSGTLAGGRLISTLNSTLLRSLNGGQGITQLGQVRITDRAGNQSTLDFSGAQTLDAILSIFRSQPEGAQVQVEMSSSGLGLIVKDASGGTGALKIEDLSGTTAQDLKIAAESTGETLRGGPLYRQYISGNTRLSDMNAGQGIAAGLIRITDSAGHTGTVDTSAGSDMRLQDVINKINNSDNLHVEARINDTGDGLLIIDKAGGTGSLKIEDDGSTTAANLRLAGTAKTGQDRIDGRSSVEINLDSGASLNTVAETLNGLGTMLQASIINDGSSVAPYRLVITAANTGVRGALAIDAGGSYLNFSTLVKAQDAIVYYGGDGVTGGVPIVSSDNKLDNVIAGTTLTLTGQSDKALTVTVAKNTEGLSTQLSAFVEKYNDAMSRLQEMTKYNADTGTRGVLLGDSTVERLRDNLYRMTTIRVGTGRSRKSMDDIGVAVAGDGKISFNAEKFRKAFEGDSTGVRDLFTASKTGFFAQLNDILTSLTDSTSGLLPQRNKALADRESLYNKRIADMNVLLSSKEARLNAQFQAMESALAKLQTQQASLSSLSQMAASMKSGA